jgi:hypothetical protein
MKSPSYLCARVCVCVCLSSDSNKLQCNVGWIFPTEVDRSRGRNRMLPRSPDSTQRLISSLEYSRTQRTAANRGMWAKLKGKSETQLTELYGHKGFCEIVCRSECWSICARLQDVRFQKTTIQHQEVYRHQDYVNRDRLKFEHLYNSHCHNSQSLQGFVR